MEFSQAEQNQRVAAELVNACIQMVGDELFETIYQQHKASRALKEDAKPVQEEKPKKATKAKKVVKTDEEEEKKPKRIPRMSAPMLKQLQSEISKADAEVDMDNKKEMDKIKKNFVAYVDDLTEEDFSAKNIAQHMGDFVKMTFTKKEEEKKEEADETIHQLTLKELQAIEKLSESEQFGIGIYWDGDSGRKVAGPDRNQEEELEEKTFKKHKYIVGDQTGRIYNDNDDQDFVGYIGVGKFKDMI